ncbi:hypothetical protein [Saccharopolyspora gregorii]|uniref:Uncharacterized protein n=1 Tax=Saccharopolyspora gregorii TaxID=33914 RepID=A0ABP6S134_9PSEU|nr:hypothetical protein [Saccharopolyspora gregorii]
MDPRHRTHRRLHLVPAAAGPAAGGTGPPTSTGAAPDPGSGGGERPPSAPEPLTDDRVAECTDAGLVAEIRACEALRHRLLHDQLTLLTEARRRGLRLPAGPSPARSGGAPT